MSYLLVVAPTLSWLELSLGIMRLFLRAVVLAGVTIALEGWGLFFATGSEDALMPYNLLAVCALLARLTAVSVSALSRRF
jgi:hypothetical protein